MRRHEAYCERSAASVGDAHLVAEIADDPVGPMPRDETPAGQIGVVGEGVLLVIRVFDPRGVEGEAPAASPRCRSDFLPRGPTGPGA